MEPQRTLYPNSAFDLPFEDFTVAETSTHGDLGLDWPGGMALEGIQNDTLAQDDVSDESLMSRPSYHLARCDVTTLRPSNESRLACPDYKSAAIRQTEPECNNISARSINEVITHLNNRKGPHRKVVEDCGNCHEVFLSKETAAAHKNGSSTCPESKFVTTAPGATIARWKAIYCTLTKSDGEIPSPYAVTSSARPTAREGRWSPYQSSGAPSTPSHAAGHERRLVARFTPRTSANSPSPPTANTHSSHIQLGSHATSESGHDFSMPNLSSVAEPEHADTLETSRADLSVTYDQSSTGIQIGASVSRQQQYEQRPAYDISRSQRFSGERLPTASISSRYGDLAYESHPTLAAPVGNGEFCPVGTDDTSADPLHSEYDSRSDYESIFPPFLDDSLSSGRSHTATLHSFQSLSLMAAGTTSSLPSEARTIASTSNHEEGSERSHDMLMLERYLQAPSAPHRGMSPQNSDDPDPDSLICDNCQQAFSGAYQRGNLARHRRHKHGHGKAEQSYPCEAPGCLKEFLRQDARLKHYRRMHPGLAAGPAIPRKR